MARLFLQIGGLLFLNKRHKSVRSGIIFLLANFLLLGGIVFSIEIILIFLGVENVFVPMTSAVWNFFTKLFF